MRQRRIRKPVTQTVTSQLLLLLLLLMMMMMMMMFVVLVVVLWRLICRAALVPVSPVQYTQHCNFHTASACNMKGMSDGR